MTEPFVTDDANDQLPTDGGQLRKLLEAQIKLNKGLQKELDEIKEADVKRAVSDTWDKLKVPAGLRKGYKGEESPQAIEEWWNDMKPFVKVGDDSTEDVQPEQQSETDAQRDQRQQIQATQQASNLGGDLSSSIEEGMEKARALRDRGSAISQAELDEVFRDLGISK